ncbi:MAG: GNAT family N-acetyltransferase [Turicibacter sp.]
MRVIKAYEQKHFADAFRIRTNVFVGEQGVPANEEIDELDGFVPIFVAYSKEEVALGTARVIVTNEGLGKIGRVAVDKAHRRKGVGQLLMRETITYIEKETNANAIKLSAQLSAIPFYESLGFESYGETYLDAGIEHIDMKISIVR